VFLVLILACIGAGLLLHHPHHAVAVVVAAPLHPDASRAHDLALAAVAAVAAAAVHHRAYHYPCCSLGHPYCLHTFVLEPCCFETVCCCCCCCSRLRQTPFYRLQAMAVEVAVLTSRPVCVCVTAPSISSHASKKTALMMRTTWWRTVTESACLDCLRRIRLSYYHHHHHCVLWTSVLPLECVCASSTQPPLLHKTGKANGRHHGSHR